MNRLQPLQKGLLRQGYVLVIADVLRPSSSWRSSILQLSQSDLDFVFEVLHFPHENPARDFATYVESSTQPSVVVLCMIGGARSFSVEMVTEVQLLTIWKPLMKEY